MSPTFTELLPVPGRTVDPLQDIPAEYRPAKGEMPWVYTNMISTLDGATALEGLSGGLGGPCDRQVFRGLRSAADAIIVGSKTAASENYRPAADNHLGLKPPVVVISSNLDLPPSLPLFSDPTNKPILATTRSAPSSQISFFERMADLVTVGDSRVDLEQLLLVLRSRGAQRVLLEGGPRLNGQFIAKGLVDEWNLTISPLLVSGGSDRAAHGPPASGTRPLDLKRLWVCDDLIFGRWLKQ